MNLNISQLVMKAKLSLIVAKSVKENVQLETKERKMCYESFETESERDSVKNVVQLKQKENCLPI